MCLGVPMQIAGVTGIAGQMTDGTLADLSLTPEAGPGDWVLVFLGAAREVLTPETAAQISAALDGLRSLMAGGNLGDAFADLDNRTPTLPPHLQAAFDAGQPTG